MAGAGDEDGLGWPGRLRRMSPDAEKNFTFYNLGVRGNSSTMIAERWRAEIAARLSDGMEGWVMLTMGNNDAAEFEDGTLRVPLEKTLANVRGIVSELARWRRTLWISPTPVDESRMLFYSRQLGKNLTFRNARLGELATHFAAIAAEFGVPYFDLFGKLQADADWRRAIALNDGLHPDGSGYEAVARLISGWDAWKAELAKAA
jgi:acyl-CoA thioesterase-1